MFYKIENVSLFISHSYSRVIIFFKLIKTISPMPVGQFTEVYGFITQEKFLRGKSLAELEDLLGFQTGRLAQGAVVLALSNLLLEATPKLQTTISWNSMAII
jgi:hypothetical protein